MLHELQRRLDELAALDALPLLAQPRRGIEREALRVNADGQMAMTPHPRKLGSALTHDYITTDFAENLLEFITPVTHSVEELLGSLGDIHGFAARQLGEERLWPLSMPCFVSDEDSIPLADYGSSNIGRMKHTYRQGLKHRYGAMMQLISGVHYNFSLPEAFWDHWPHGDASEGYMGLLRNFRRQVWMLPYLFGASPALCGSFLGGDEHHLPFKHQGRGTLVLPHATSLRMSDLGYTNKAQASLRISHDHLADYIRDLRHAIQTPSKEYQAIGLKVNGQYRQLSTNLLQIENELYAPIRPKRVTASGEKPTDALERAGIQYVEVRALDVDPFSPLGIDADTVRFLDLFLLGCLLLPSPPMSERDWQESHDNFTKAVLEGRRPGLMLSRSGQAISLRHWFAEMLPVWETLARVMDGEQGHAFADSLKVQQAKMADPDLTPSARLLRDLGDGDNGALGLVLAGRYQQQLRDGYHSRYLDDAALARAAIESLTAQQRLEAADELSFDDFLDRYFDRVGEQA
ncbi:glutamate--cysteine ligase [Gallaecimonas sp. GXIMD4217]|uniref:glutamate--cysteine ligase n=1 Tax=Gallaecimonas sp. GXIMD4217 TaxID=3131927 RepID=UPI00311AF7EE